MNYSDLIRLMSGLLQFGVACYALRLCRRFNTARVGWLLFSGLSLLAVMYLLLPLNPFRSGIPLGTKGDMVYALMAILLLVGMAHIDLKFKNRPQPESAPLPPERAPDSSLEQNIAELTKINEELQQHSTQLQVELAEKNQLQDGLQQECLEAKTQVEELTRQISELTEKISDLAKTNEELRNSTTSLLARLQVETGEHQRAQIKLEQVHQNELTVIRHDGVVEVASGVLLHLNKALACIHSVSLEADHLTRSRTARVVRLARSLRLHASQSDHPRNPRPQPKPLRGKRSRIVRRRSAARPPVGSVPKSVPVNLPPIAWQFSSEQALLQKKLDSVRKKLELIRETLLMQERANQLPRANGANTLTASPDALPQVQAGGEPALQQLQPLSVAAEPTAGNPENQRATAGPLQELVIQNVTETGTELPRADEAGAPPEGNGSRETALDESPSGAQR